MIFVDMAGSESIGRAGVGRGQIEVMIFIDYGLRVGEPLLSFSYWQTKWVGVKFGRLSLHVIIRQRIPIVET